MEFDVFEFSLSRGIACDFVILLILGELGCLGLV